MYQDQAAACRRRRRRSPAQDQPGEHGADPAERLPCGREVEVRGLELQKVEDRGALDRGAARDGEGARLVARRGAADGFSDVQDHGDRRAVELVGEFGPAQRQSVNHVASEGDGEPIGIEALERGGRGGERGGGRRGGARCGRNGNVVVQ